MAVDTNKGKNARLNNSFPEQKYVVSVQYLLPLQYLLRVSCMEVGTKTGMFLSV